MKQKKLQMIILSILFMILWTGCAIENEKKTMEEAVQTIIDLLNEGNFNMVYSEWFDKSLQEALSEQKLSEVWEEKTAQGDSINIDSFYIDTPTANIDVVKATVKTSIETFDIRLVFNENQNLVGFHLSEGRLIIEPDESIKEEEIIVGEGTPYELDGLLTLPIEQEDKLPALVLVHGSGPSDKDEAVFAYKPFRDIAYGIAEKGIAVLRYDKRTYTYGRQMRQAGKNITVYEETVEDAILAIELAKADPRIDEEHIFLAGHSLGGMLAPRIDLQGGDVYGFVILAGSPRSLIDIVFDQNKNLVEEKITNETERKKEMKVLEEEYKIAKNLQDMTDETAQNIQVFGINGLYIKEMEKFIVSELIEEQNKPFLILQGDDDFQVYANKDFQLWKDLLESRDEATLINYPSLNHFFIEYEGPYERTVEEYNVPNQVDEAVIKDIGHWIWNQME